MFDEHEQSRIRTIGISSNNETFSINNNNSETFSSIKNLIDNFVTSKKAIIDNICLINPVTRQAWELLNSDLQITIPEIVLGKGTFGVVQQGKLVKNSSDVAVKKANRGEMTEILLGEILEEARIMRHVEHVNIIKIYGVVIETLPIMIVIELIDGCSLSKLLINKEIPVGHRLSMVSGIMYGLWYVHDKKYIHRDVAARNVLVSKDFTQIKLIDFGLSRRGPIYSIQSTQKVPTKWLSPEALIRGIFSCKSDVWAFGITIWEIYNDGVEPYESKTKSEVRTFLSDRHLFAENQLNLQNTKSEEKPPPGLHKLLKNIFRFNEDIRPTMAKIVSSFETEIIPHLTGADLENCKLQQNRGGHSKSPITTGPVTISSRSSRSGRRSIPKKTKDSRSNRSREKERKPKTKTKSVSVSRKKDSARRKAKSRSKK
ncbi:unnamed protein product [Caenorhabditis angaria]|uniref:Protein kinase domain-containing protein n=1 Tax=Caenorhabditis angaria TaxID=860376 RepID=A0A9P1N1N6_9PELO|nr:unnamed protein product [Caenorhabditis angaria]